MGRGALLGLLQGLTEFLPVSSSGHLTIAQELLHFQGPRVLFDVVLHLATFFCIAIYFRRQLYDLAQALPRLFKSGDDPDRRFLRGILIATLPTGILGLAIHHYEDLFFEGLVFSSSMLLATGGILLLSNRRSVPPADTPQHFYRKSFWVGLAQGLAVLPGISRSGSTITAGLLVGFDRESAFRFSFLGCLPAIAGALLLKLKDADALDAGQWPTFLTGFAVAFLSGYASLWMLNRLVKGGKLIWFAPYCFLLGGGMLIYHFFLR